ncbi:alpha/beta fold hydrolase [Antarcticimicrobium luteum]|uniref:Alpha/beta fold hydrolase n=1 Tax=Antarcticimicrobium luteum TaxID=2547397 RepID=A0A4R5V985_9RHOB|nr:alpha/beta hydrolase [Antarcticimicrobium luteum]TDK48672.1 alpha/beta fold hydrolase [Antarcticimicrobium luteum]
MALMTVNGADLFVEEFGAGEDVVIFTHALFFSGQMYARQIARLSGRYRCVTVDWRGMGRSGKPLGGYDVDNLCRDVIGVADALGIDRFHWVGMSVGGVAGIRLAAQMPERFRSLAIGGASAEAEPIEKVVKYESLLLQGFARDPESVVDGLLPILYGEPFRTDPARAESLARERALIVANDGPAVARASAPILRRVDIRHMLPHVACPTYIFCGALDGANPPEKSRTIAQGIQGCRLEVFDGIGHQPNVEAPDLLAERLLAHLGDAAA